MLLHPTRAARRCSKKSHTPCNSPTEKPHWNISAIYTHSSHATTSGSAKLKPVISSHMTAKLSPPRKDTAGEAERRSIYLHLVWTTTPVRSHRIPESCT